jgi:hypothetical protein
MGLHYAVSVAANFAAIALLIAYGLKLFAEYHARGRWAKNATSLLAGVGMLMLALALLITPENAEIIARIAATGAARVLLVFSSALLLAAMAAFGVITYSRPLRLRLERKIESDLKRDLPNIP